MPNVLRQVSRIHVLRTVLCLFTQYFFGLVESRSPKTFTPRSTFPIVFATHLVSIPTNNNNYTITGASEQRPRQQARLGWKRNTNIEQVPSVISERLVSRLLDFSKPILTSLPFSISVFTNQTWDLQATSLREPATSFSPVCAKITRLAHLPASIEVSCRPPPRPAGWPPKHRQSLLPKTHPP